MNLPYTQQTAQSQLSPPESGTMEKAVVNAIIALLLNQYHNKYEFTTQQTTQPSRDQLSPPPEWEASESSKLPNLLSPLPPPPP